MPAPLQQTPVRRSRRALPAFTLREKQVLRDLAENKPLKETAADLGIGLNTVEYHRSKIVHKTRISGIAGLTQFALRYGFASWIVCLVLMAGCAHPSYAPIEGRLMAAERQMSIFQNSNEREIMDTLPVPRLEWDWIPSGPVWFEVWHSADLSNFKFAGGTNVPTGFTLFTNVPRTYVPLRLDRAQDFFIVRAVNDAGPGNWAGAE